MFILHKHTVLVYSNDKIMINTGQPSQPQSNTTLEKVRSSVASITGEQYSSTGSESDSSVVDVVRAVAVAFEGGYMDELESSLDTYVMENEDKIKKIARKGHRTFVKGADYITEYKQNVQEQKHIVQEKLRRVLVEGQKRLDTLEKEEKEEERKQAEKESARQDAVRVHVEQLLLDARDDFVRGHYHCALQKLIKVKRVIHLTLKTKFCHHLRQVLQEELYTLMQEIKQDLDDGLERWSDDMQAIALDIGDVLIRGGHVRRLRRLFVIVVVVVVVVVAFWCVNAWLLTLLTLLTLFMSLRIV